ncbi:hypothetical protein C7B61_16140, partial [filamentous cyanobacterium CCP1]
IEALRISKGLNQEQFAREIGIRRETVSKWENSKYERLLQMQAPQHNCQSSESFQVLLQRQFESV